jgi:adenine-specific DNA methylase
MKYEKKLIEGRFPCQQVGAETNRERGAISTLPPVYYLHVWWARRPLTPSRAAVLGSILPADTDPELFLRELGIVKKQVIIGGQRWTIVGKNLELIETDSEGEYIPFSDKFHIAFDKENARREIIRNILKTLIDAEQQIGENPVVLQWLKDNEHINIQLLTKVNRVEVIETSADPAGVNQRIAFASSDRVITILGDAVKIDPEDLYGYGRAYESPVLSHYNGITVLDPTAGGGSIPFEAMRLGCNVIANDLNPVATAIEKATIQYPAQYGEALIIDIAHYGQKLVDTVVEKSAPYIEIHTSGYDDTLPAKEAIEWLKWELLDRAANGY